MPTLGTPQVRPITDEDLGAVGAFLHRNLNPRVGAQAWQQAVRAPWQAAAPNHGFQLRLDGRIVGVQLAFYSEREIDGVVERFCNLGAWCVLDGHRADGLRLLRAVLGQGGYHFTDLSPSGNVVALNERLRFRHLDTRTALMPALPWLPTPGVRVTSSSAELRRRLRGADRRIYDDHVATAAARHVLITAGDRSCYVILRRDRRKGLPGFGSVLHVSDPELYARTVRRLAAHLLWRHRVVAVLAEVRVAGPPPRGSVLLRRNRPKMFRSDRLRADQVDDLYSELTCVAW